MSPDPAPHREHLVRMIAERHSIRVDKDDPLFAVGTICEAYIDEAGRRFDDLIKSRMGDFQAAAERIEKRTGQLVAQQFNEHLSAVRHSLQADIILAGAKANEIVYRVEQACRYPVMLRWAVTGMFLGLLIMLIGICIGAMYLN